MANGVKSSFIYYISSHIYYIVPATYADKHEHFRVLYKDTGLQYLKKKVHLAPLNFGAFVSDTMNFINIST